MKDGRPQLDSQGRFVPIGSGRPGSDTAAAAASATRSTLPPDTAPGAEEAVPTLTAEIGVEVAIGLIQTALIMVGEEEGELTELEAKMLRGPLQRILAKYNLDSKMTPELECASVVAALILRRMKRPKTQGWFLSKLAWVKGWWNARKLKRAVADPIPA